jgi:hypothetical protein
MLRRLIALAALSQANLIGASETLPIFDTHIHHNDKTQGEFDDQRVVSLLQQYDIKKALVSSSGDAHTQRLKGLAPDTVLPSLRPYRKSGELRTWMHDESVIEHLETHIKQNRYYAIGEFHAFGDEMLTPVSKRLVALAKEHNLVLHLHGDRQAMLNIYNLWPDAKVLWAHAGFEEPGQLEPLFEQFPNLWADLSFRPEIVTWGGFNPEWEKALLKNPDRFTLGADTFNVDQWQKMPLYTLDTRDWLGELPETVAKQIAYRNAERLFGISIND